MRRKEEIGQGVAAPDGSVGARLLVELTELTDDPAVLPHPDRVAVFLSIIQEGLSKRVCKGRRRSEEGMRNQEARKGMITTTKRLVNPSLSVHKFCGPCEVMRDTNCPYATATTFKRTRECLQNNCRFIWPHRRCTDIAERDS
jgi:hypothetical protein